MAKVKEIYGWLDSLAPFSTQMSFDNAGFLVGRGSREVHRVLVSLDITQEVAEEAAQLGAELIVAHHPILFHPARSITDEDPTGRTILFLAENSIAAICSHTNLDAAVGGVNDALAQAAGLTDTMILKPDGVDRVGRPYGIGRVGALRGGESIPLTQYAARVKAVLGAGGVRCLDAGHPVRKVAVGGGACADMLPDVLAQGCDTFLTSDVKYNGFLDAKDLGINLIDAGHFPTENVICPVLASKLRTAFPGTEVQISSRHREVFFYL